ncbi:hypothetical protein NU219Hw_g2446t1 [Hortaea werneckii]
MENIYPQQHALPNVRRGRIMHNHSAPAVGYPITGALPKPKCLPPHSGVDKDFLTQYLEYTEAEFATLAKPLRTKAYAFQMELLDQTTRKKDRAVLDVLRLRDVANNMTSVQPDPETGAADLQAYCRSIAEKGGLGVYLILGARRHPELVGLAEELLRVAVVKRRLAREEVGRAWRVVRGVRERRDERTLGEAVGVVGAGDWMAGVGLEGGLLIANEGMPSQFDGQPTVHGMGVGGGNEMSGLDAGNEFLAFNGGMFNLPNGQSVGQGMNAGLANVRHGYPTPEEDMHDQLSGQSVGPGMNMPLGSHMNGAPMYNGGISHQPDGHIVAQGMGMPFGDGMDGYPTPAANTPGQMDGQLIAPGMAIFPGIQYPTTNGGVVMPPGQQSVGLDTPLFVGIEDPTGDGSMAMQPYQQPFDQSLAAAAGNGMPDPVDNQPVGPRADFLLYDNTQVEEQLPSEMMAGPPGYTDNSDAPFALTDYSAYVGSQEVALAAAEPAVQEAGEEKAESDDLDGMDVEQWIDQGAVVNRWGAYMSGMV